MYFSIGTPERLSSLGVNVLDLAKAKSKVEIAVLDDKPFEPREALTAHKFLINELGPDIRNVDQVSSFPIVICDVGGVGKAFGSHLEGAHLLQEIRKVYPDKYLMAYTGLTYSLAITNALTSADKRLEKDASIEAWVQTLEVGINEVMNPRNRWIRLRKALLERGVETYETFKLEQAYIEAIRKRMPGILSDKANSMSIGSEFKDIVVKFAATAVATMVSSALGM